MKVVVALLLLALPASATEHAILVLGSTVRKDGRPSPGLERRLELARKLAARDHEALVVVSGGTRGGQWPAEGPAMARWLEARGVAPARIRIEGAATNTAENANLSLPILEREHVSHVTVVTERFHLARGLFHVRAAAAEAGEALRIDGAAADDGLSGEARARMDREEKAKIERDTAFRRARIGASP